MVVLVFLFFLVILSVSLSKGDDTQNTTSGVENELPKNSTVIILSETRVESGLVKGTLKCRPRLQ